MSAITAKLRGTRGESLTETLVATLIASLALLLLAGAVTTSTRVIDKSRKTIGSYYEEKTAIQNGTTETSETSMTVTITQDPSTLQPGEVQLTDSFDASYCENKVKLGKMAVGAYTLTTSEAEIPGGGGI